MIPRHLLRRNKTRDTPFDSDIKEIRRRGALRKISCEKQVEANRIFGSERYKRSRKFEKYPENFNTKTKSKIHSLGG
jgi:hypothetical protein